MAKIAPKLKDLRMAHEAILSGDLRDTVRKLIAAEISRQEELELSGDESVNRYSILQDLLDRAEKAELITGAATTDEFSDLF